MQNALRLVVFSVVVALFVGAAHVYLYRRLFRDTSANPWWRRLGRALLWVLALSAVSARALSFAVSHQIAHQYGGIGWMWLGLAIYLVLILAVMDGGRALLRLASRRRASVPDTGPQSADRRVFLARAMGISALAVAGGSAGFGIFRAYYPPAVTDVPLRLPRLPKALDGFTVVQLSDVHAGHSVHEAWMEELVSRCAALRPDLLVITGDLVDGSVAQLGSLIARLRRVPTRAGAFFVTGNHDYYAGADAWCAALPKWGIEPLRNRRVSIGDAGGSFDLVGVDDYGQKLRPNGTGYDLERAVEGRDPDRAAVLLAHRPQEFDRAAGLGVGLQLSGHTHGGQTFPFTLAAQMIWPRCAGLYSAGDSRLYVSRGVGFVGPPLRAGSPPEIVRITLLS